MKKLLFVLCLALASCSTRVSNKTTVVITDLDVRTCMGTHYVLWVGVLDAGKPAAGITPKFVDIKIGDVFIAEQYSGDDLWKLKLRINDNR